MIVPKNGKQVLLRLPDEMHELVKKYAKVNGHSVNTEIVAALARHLARGDKLTELESRIERLERNNERIDWI